MSYSIIMGIVRLLIRAVTFWNNILAESGKSLAEQLFGVAKRVTENGVNSNILCGGCGRGSQFSL